MWGEEHFVLQRRRIVGPPPNEKPYIIRLEQCAKGYRVRIVYEENRIGRQAFLPIETPYSALRVFSEIIKCAETGAINFHTCDERQTHITVV